MLYFVLRQQMTIMGYLLILNHIKLFDSLKNQYSATGYFVLKYAQFGLLELVTGQYLLMMVNRIGKNFFQQHLDY